MTITSNPKIYSRSEWGAKPPDFSNLTLYQAQRKYILVHHSAGLERNGEFSDGTEMRGIQQSHLNDEYGDIGYNFVVGYYGSLMEGRSLNYVGAHCNTNSKNYDSIGICVIGNFENPLQKFSTDAKESLISGLIYICNKYKISPDNIYGHKDWGPTACPGKNLYSELPSIISTVKQYVSDSGGGSTSNVGKYLNLKPHMQSWAVYNENGPYTTAYKIGNLSPATYGGLSYKILAEKGNDVYIIQTESFGRCAIWAPRDNDSTITTSPAYNTSGESGGGSSGNVGKYLNLKPHMQSWAVYNENGPYTTAYKIGSLAPATYGGLSYKILAEKGNDVYVIQTGSFGRCAIWAPRDNDSTITTLPVY